VVAVELGSVKTHLALAGDGKKVIVQGVRFLRRRGAFHPNDPRNQSRTFRLIASNRGESNLDARHAHPPEEARGRVLLVNPTNSETEK
jgi:hypothetical protein